ncbi:MAG TPA: hypothetical protein VH089_24590 [Streptosporangiaceae bacterium]|nr:hypothetical protein [Streptosporangiaceae bacterium]
MRAAVGVDRGQHRVVPAVDQRPGRLAELESHAGTVTGAAPQPRSDRSSTKRYRDLLTLVIGMACAWSPASGIYTATADEPDASHQRRRALLRDCVERAVAP